METWFRLRHLQSISGLNLNISIKDLNCNSIFFALSTSDQENLGYFYQSSKCENLLNPVWENIDLSYDSVKSFSFLDNFILTFFINKRNKNKILLEIKVHISGLVPISNLNSDNTDQDCQRFFYQFNNNWYSYDINSAHDYNSQNSIENPPKIRKKLYNIETINKFLGFITNDYNRQLSNAQASRRNLENRIYEYKSRLCQVSCRENKIISLRGQILLERKIRNQKDQTLSQIKKSVILLKQKITRTQENQQRTDIDISEKNKRLKGYREYYLKISNDYLLRMYQLIHELAKIFPITPTDLPVPNSAGNVQSNTITIRNSDKLSICNLYLPNNDKQITLNQDNSAFAALGMVCQLLLVLSKIYDVPLRYPLSVDDPKLSIRDEIIDIDNNDRNFLLVKSTAQNFRLQYAIYLLNLNIAAIRGYFSLSTKFPDRMLWNINSLIEGKNKIQTEMGSSSNPLLHSAQITNSSNNSSTRNLASPIHSRSSNNLSPLVTQSFPSIN